LNPNNNGIILILISKKNRMLKNSLLWFIKIQIRRRNLLKKIKLWMFQSVVSREFFS